MIKSDILKIGRHVLQSEAEAISNFEKNLDSTSFVKALQLLNATKGKVVISGIGKSGIIAKKIAATLSSTGTFGLFVHPVEALHGDIGMIKREDTLIIISHSGETTEILSFLKAVRHLQNKIIAITSNEKSLLAKEATITLATHVNQEACNICGTFNLTPTTSTIVSLALGDALALALQETKGYNIKHFAMVHQGGALGKKVNIVNIKKNKK